MKQSRNRAASGWNALWYGHGALRWLLWPVALVFRLLVAARRRAYVLHWIKSHRVTVPVVVVGNISVGGTGKTPLTIWLAGKLLERGYRVGIVCRGYGGAASTWPQLVNAESDARQVGDEPKLLFERTGCAVAAGPDRVAAAEALLAAANVDVILLDDGLQHYRIRRDFEIAVIDGTRGLGNGLCLPAGPLREPPMRLAEVDAVVVNDGDFRYAGALRARVRLTHVVAMHSGERRALSDFRGQRVHAVAAIGSPERFFSALQLAGLQVIPHPHADHAVIDAADLDFEDGLAVLITEKDAVKCRTINIRNVWTVAAEIEFDTGDAERLPRMLEQCLRNWQSDR